MRGLGEKYLTLVLIVAMVISNITTSIPIKAADNVTSREVPEKEADNTICLLVQCSGKLPDTYGAVESRKTGNLWILQYSEMVSAQKAMECFKQEKQTGGIQSVEWNEQISTAVENRMSYMEKETIESSEKMQIISGTEMKINSRGILVAVIDTGYDKERGCMDRIIDSGCNFSGTGCVNDMTDDMGHGTQIASIILANTKENVKVMPIKALDTQGTGDVLSIYQGICYGIDKKADIINLSVEAYEILSSPILMEAITEAGNQGIMVVVSAGNQGVDISKFLKNHPENMLVISSVSDNVDSVKTFENVHRSSFSNYGMGIDFAACGSVRAYGLQRQLQEVSGTSVSAAIISAVAAECMVLDNSCEYSRIRRLMEESAYSSYSQQQEKYFGKGVLGKTVVNALYESKVCEQAEIFQCDYEAISDEILNKIIQTTTEVNLRLFLKNLSDIQLQRLLKRDTDLNKTFQKLTLDKEGKVIENRKQPYYAYLLEERFHTQSVTTFGCTTGYFYGNYSQDGKKSKTTKITVRVTNVLPNVTFTNVPVYTLTSSDTDVFYIADEQTGTDADSSGNYYMLNTMLCRDKVPAHYTATSWVDDHTQSDNSDVVGLQRVTTGHQERPYTCEFLLNVDTNGTGLTWWGPQQANGIDTSHKYESLARHTTITVEFSSWKEKLYIHPNGGSYTYTKSGEEITKKEKFLLATRQCGKKSTISIPKRKGYIFKGWKITHEKGGNGSYDSNTGKYTFCGKEESSITTLKAIWQAITPKPTNTATPKPTNTATPKPTNTATPKPTNTAKPKPTNTATPKPTNTATPKPTNTPIPLVTVPPRPSNTPKLTNTATPKPTNTAKPKPTNTATPKPLEFWVSYERNEPTEVTPKLIQDGEPVKYVVKDSQRLLEVGDEPEAEFKGWCLGIGQWSNSGEASRLQSVYWLTETGTFSTQESKVERNGRICTTDYRGEVFEDKAQVKRLLSYVEKVQEEIRAGEQANQRLVLVGKWDVVIEFDAMGGEAPKELQEVIQVPADEEYTIPKEEPEQKGCLFSKWLDSSRRKEYTSLESVPGFGKNTVLQAQYKYKVQYQTGNGSVISDGEGQKEFIKIYGQKVTLRDVTYPAKENTTGYHYEKQQKWQVIPSGEGLYRYGGALNYPGKYYKDEYIQGESGIVNRSVILRAVEKANTYYIQYYGNAGNASTRELVSWGRIEGRQLITYDKKETLQKIEENSLPGYKFQGWNTKADGSGISFDSGEDISTKEFLEKTDTEAGEQGKVIALYAQWRPNTYWMTFHGNTPTKENNTHSATTKARVSGATTIAYVWDSYITENKINNIPIPDAVLTGWHPRYADSLWYTQKAYDNPGMALEDNVQLGYSFLGMPGEKDMYAQWEANTYRIVYHGLPSQEESAIKGQVASQNMVYDLPSALAKNAYERQDAQYRYHQDEQLTENIYHTKYNPYSKDNFQYSYLGWSRIPISKMRLSGEESWIPKYMAVQEKIWNFTNKDKDSIDLYACWDGIPNITTKTKDTHFERYEGAKITGKDMLDLVTAFDYEQGENIGEADFSLRITNISYYDGDVLLGSIDNPKDNYMLDTTLPKEQQKVGGYKTYKITYEAIDEWGIGTYHEDKSGKRVTYTGKIRYNQCPEIMSWNGEKLLLDRYLYLNDIKKLSAKELEERLMLSVKGIDKEDKEFLQDKDNLLYQGRLWDIMPVAVLENQRLWQEILLWISEKPAEGASEQKWNYTISYRDIFGKSTKAKAFLHVIDGEQVVKEEQQKGKQAIRFISRQYLDTIHSNSKWHKNPEAKKLLDAVLQDNISQGEIYQLEKGEVKKP